MVQALFLLLFLLLSPPVWGQSGAPIRQGQSCGGDLGGTFPDCTVLSTTLNEQLLLTNLGLRATASDSNPTCSAGVYAIYADLSEQKWKACTNGVVSDLVGSGAGIGDDTFQSVYDNGDGIINGVSCAKPIQFRDTPGTSSWGFCIDTGVPKIISTCAGASCDRINTIPTGKQEKQVCGSTDCETITSAGVQTYLGNRRPWGSYEWDATDVRGDGTQCEATATTETINGKAYDALHCTMTASETDGYIISSRKPVRLPDNFDNSSTVLVRSSWFLLTDAGAQTRHGTLQLDCAGDQVKPGDNVTTAVNFDIPIADGHIVGDWVVASHSGIDLAAAGCVAGSRFFWTINVCDADTSPTGECQSGGGVENDLAFAHMSIEIRKNSETE